MLFCGHLGTRIREYSENIPKPMIPIGSQPIMWHLMQYYSQLGTVTSCFAWATSHQRLFSELQTGGH